MRTIRWIGFVSSAFLSLIVGTRDVRAEWVDDVNVMLGVKELSTSDWWPTRSQVEYGILASFAPKTWPVRIAAGALVSEGTEHNFPSLATEWSGRTSELGIGVSKVWDAKRMRPYVGGGLAVFDVQAHTDAPRLGDIEHAQSGGSQVGPWLDAGIYWRLAQSLNLGFELRFSAANVDVETPVSGTVRAPGGGFHFGVIVGFGG